MRSLIATATSVVLALLIGFWAGAGSGITNFSPARGWNKVTDLLSTFGPLIVTALVITAIGGGIYWVARDGITRREAIFMTILAAFIIYVLARDGLFMVAWNAVWNPASLVVLLIGGLTVVAQLIRITITRGGEDHA